MIPRQEVIALANKLAWKCKGVEPRVARLALAVVMALVIRAEKGPEAASTFKAIMSQYFQREDPA